MAKETDAPSACVKRAFRSIKHARAANRGFGGRMRVYQCEACRWYHVTASEKRENWRGWR
jgi:hypothetical protein